MRVKGCGKEERGEGERKGERRGVAIVGRGGVVSWFAQGKILN